MNVGGGEAADQMVRMMLSSGEVAIRLTGSAMKNLLALTMALAKDHKRLSGKINMGKMLRETRDIRLFPMTPEQYKRFCKLARRQKLLYSAIHDKDPKGDMDTLTAWRHKRSRRQKSGIQKYALCWCCPIIPPYGQSKSRTVLTVPTIRGRTSAY